MCITLACTVCNTAYYLQIFLNSNLYFLLYEADNSTAILQSSSEHTDKRQGNIVTIEDIINQSKIDQDFKQGQDNLFVNVTAQVKTQK